MGLTVDPIYQKDFNSSGCAVGSNPGLHKIHHLWHEIQVYFG